MNVSLLTSAHAAPAHESVFLPWLKRVAASAFRERRVTAVVVPRQADAYFLKSRALASGIGLLGVHFLTPAQLRERLAAHLGIAARIAPRPLLHLLIATAAERVAERRAAGAGSVVAAPDQLLKAIELLSDGGWNFSEVGPPALRPIAAEFERLREATGQSAPQQIDRALLAASAAAAPYFADLFVIGFNAPHWSLWPLLESAVRCSVSAAVCLTDPRLEAEELDAAWIGTWEETFGAAEPIASDFTPPFADLLRLPENAAEREARASEPAPEIAFLVGHDTAGQARAIVAQALHFLANPDCERLGVLFPGAGALSRRVGELLAQLEVPHHHGLPHSAPGLLEDPVWPAWLELQESPRLPALLRYLQAQVSGEFAGLSVERATDELQRVYQELLLDDLGVLAEFLARHPRRQNAPALAAAIRAISFLPDRASLTQFFARTRQIFHEQKWSERLEKLDDFERELRNAGRLEITRRTWLRWLAESLESWKAERAAAGAHPYSRLHLLPYHHAETQAWTHLIATGLNEGEWPPSLEDAGFLGEEEIDALNRRLRTLNTRAVTQGRQGEGHLAVQPGKAFCLGPAQHRALTARQFFNTLESTTVALAVTAQLHEEAAPDRPFNASEFFAHVYFCARGRALAQDTMSSLRAATDRAIASFPVWENRRAVGEAGRMTRSAFDIRRRTGAPFGEYEFALRRPPQPPLRLAAKRWEDALAAPALVWLASVLGVDPPRRDEETPWTIAQGNWVHDWLRALTGEVAERSFAPLPASTELLARVSQAALNFRERVSAILANERRELPDWWRSAWEQALGLAQPLARSVAAVTGRTHVAAEWKLAESSLPIGESALRIRGRIDLLLTTEATIEDAWIVDYKTGHRKGLRVSDLARGDGLQLALYALALRAAGAREVGLSLLTAGASLEAPQLTLTDLDQLDELWRGLVFMQESGVFGMRGALRDEYGFRSSYPLATLAIDEEILAEKWQRTHPGLAPEGDES